VSVQAADPGSVLNAYRAMIRFRHAQPALRLGSMQLLDSPEGSIALLREHGGQTLLAAFNFGPDPLRLPLPSLARVEPIAGHGFEPCEIDAGHVVLPAAGAFFGLLRHTKK
jgi:alpha-glucosidase